MTLPREVMGTAVVVIFAPPVLVTTVRRVWVPRRVRPHSNLACLRPGGTLHPRDAGAANLAGNTPQRLGLLRHHIRKFFGPEELRAFNSRSSCRATVRPACTRVTAMRM